MAKGQLEFDAVVSTDQLNKLLGDLRSGADGAAKAINDALGGTVTKKLVLETVTDESGSKQLVAVEKERLSVADKIVSAYRQADKVQAGSLTSLRQQVNEAKQARDAIAKYSEGITSTGGKIRQINGEWAVANQRLAGLNRQLDIASASNFWDRVKVGLRAEGLISFSNGLVQITQGLQAASILVGGFIAQINNLVTAVAKLESFKLGFIAAGAGATGGAQALEQASRIALGLGSNLSVVRDGFQKLTPVVLNSGGSLDNVSQITEALSSRFAAFGLSADSSRRVMNGVIQAFAKGKLQAEELTQQISEADPAFKTDFANAVGVSVQELERLVKAGEITTDVLIRALPGLSKSSLLYGKLGSSAASAVNALNKSNNAIDGVGVTTEQVRTQLDNLTQLNFERLALALQPVINSFLRAQAVVIDFIGYISQLEGVRGIGNVIAALSESVINLIDALLKIASAVATAISPILQLIGAIANTGPGVAVLTTLIGVKLVAAFGALPKAALSGAGSLAQLGASLARSTAQYAGLGIAAQAAADQVAASQAKIGAAASAGGAAQGLGAAAAGAGIGSAYLPKDELTKTAVANKKLADASKLAATSNAQLNRQLTANTVASGATAVAATKGAAATNMFAAAGNALKSAMTAAIAPLSGAALAFAAVLAAAGSVAIAMSVYKNVMSDANQINEKTALSIAEIDKALVKVGASNTNTNRTWSDTVQEIGFVGATFELLKERLGGAAIQTAKFNQGTIALAKSSEEFNKKIDRLNNEYTKLRANSNGSAESKQKEKELSDALKNAYASEIASLQTLIAEKEKERTGDAGAQEAKRREIDLAKSRIQQLELEAKARGVSTEKLKEQEIATGLVSRALGELNTGLKAAQEALANSDFGSKEFNEAAKNIAVLKMNIDKITQTSEDPLYLFKILPDFIKEAGNEIANLESKNQGLQKTLERVAEIQGIINGLMLEALVSGDLEKANQYAAQLVKLETRRNKITKDIQINEESLQKARRKLNDLTMLDKQVRIKLAIEEFDFQTKLREINNKFTKDEFRIRVGLDQAEFRNIVLQVTDFKDQIFNLLRERAKLQLRLQTPGLSDSERLGINRELVSNAAQVRSQLAAGAADLADAGYRLRQSLADAVTQLRNLKLSNLRFLPIEEQRKALQELDQEVQRIADQKGLNVTFRGTKEERTREKQAFVDFYNQLDKSQGAVVDLQNAVNFVDQQLKKLAESGVAGVFQGIADSMTNASTQIYKAAESLLGLDGKSITIKVNYSGAIPGRWTGGPVDAGSQYRVNELGQEGFLSTSGRISAINRPKNALWRAPSSGTVIPADVWSNLRVPNPVISANRPISSGFSGGNGLAKIARVLQAGMARNAAPAGLGELAAVQAHQAKQIGKLGRAVDDLASKDWNVNVKVKNVGNAAYLEALNHRM